MAWKVYECNSCSYNIFLSEEEKKLPDSCPMCRGPMYKAGEIEEKRDAINRKCSECGFSFNTAADALPSYKCPNCNFTFPTTPGRKVEHKL